MQHRVKKIKFTKGQDANQALVHKLVTDFIRHEHIEITLSRAKMLKGVIDRLTNRAKTRNEAHRNVLLSALHDKVLVEKLFKIGEERFSTRHTGFVTLKRLGMRQGDGAEVARLEWVEMAAVVEKKEIVPVKEEKATASKEVKPKKVTKPKTVTKPKKAVVPKKAASPKKTT